jgi:hypothetical protein
VRGRELERRAVVDLRAGDLRVADLRVADLRVADLRVADLRVADLRVADLRVADLRAVAGLAALDVERDALAFLARVPVAFFLAPVFARRVLALRAPVERPARDDAAAPPAALAPLSLHLPDITRCAASATASAMIEPNLVALAIMLVAACDAVSAASIPASRILRRAAGLALIAAAAAASPAASISLLIAALASLSTALSPEPDDDREEGLDEVLRVDLAIA